jgi:hypothetical protein
MQTRICSIYTMWVIWAVAAVLAPAIKTALDTLQAGAPFLLEIIAKEGYDFSRYPS